MSESDGSRPAGRGNGLQAGRWAPVADLDPRVADDLLIALHVAGIAARVEPTPATAGGYMELRLPDRPTDRLLVDGDQLVTARGLVDRELAELGQTAHDLPPTDPDPLDVLAPLDAATWHADDPIVEEVQAIGGTGTDPAEEEHYSPPPAPPLPRLRPTTIASLALILVGIAILVTGVDGGSFGLLGVLAVLAGIGSLIWHMKDGPPQDSGWDDGAVL